MKSALRTVIALLFFPLVALAARPNVLLIITDDQGYGDFSIYGNPHVRTPNIDRLGEQSVRFDRYYVNSFCAPTRAALLTGRWPVRTGVHGVTHNKEAMRPSELTIAEALGSAGYATACIGKWHNGEQYPYTPAGQGFEHGFGFNNGHWNSYFDAELLRGTKMEKTRGYITDVFTDEAMRFIDSKADQPFFCYLAYNAPHSPYQVPDKYFDRFKAKGFEDNVAAFYGMCENLDDNIGRLLKHVDERGLSDNTIVLFMTDNGGTAGVKIYNAGMRGGKTSVHEGGSRVPLFVHWPAAGWRPHVSKPIVAHVDVFPTLMDLCGVKAPAGPALDGISLRPLLEETGSWPERTLFTHNPIDETNKFPGAVRTQKYRLVREIKGSGGGSKAKANDASATPWQLYDMEADPAQEKDIAAEKPNIVADLSARYDAWFADISKDGLQRFPIPVGFAQHDPVDLHAPQAFYDKPLKFASRPGFANDWLTAWTDASAKVWFDIDVVNEGNYQLELAFAATSPCKLKLSAAGSSLSVEVPAAPPVDLHLPHRDEDGKTKYRDRQWSTVDAGGLHLTKGRTQLMLECINKSGEEVVDLKHVRIKCLEK